MFAACASAFAAIVMIAEATRVRGFLGRGRSCPFLRPDERRRQQGLQAERRQHGIVQPSPSRVPRGRAKKTSFVRVDRMFHCFSEAAPHPLSEVGHGYTHARTHTRTHHHTHTRAEARTHLHTHTLTGTHSVSEVLRYFFTCLNKHSVL